VTSASPDAYRRGVGIMLLNGAREVFVGRRIDQQEEAWQMPQGGIDGDETPRQAAFRELREEAGTDQAEIVAESAGWYRYDLRKTCAAACGAGAIAARPRNGSPCASPARTPISTSRRTIPNSTLGSGSRMTASTP